MSEPLPDPAPLFQEFYQALIRENLSFRDHGLLPGNRVSAFLTSGLAVADMAFQEEEGRALDEMEFLILARAVFRAVREGLTAVPGGPSS